MKLPGLDDMDYDPEGVYEKLTGAKKPDATSQDCMGVVLDTVTDKVRLLSNVKPKDKGPSYTYVETDFIRALKYGYVCEVQEPTVIMQPGVLVGLNSLLEQTGSIQSIRLRIPQEPSTMPFLRMKSLMSFTTLTI